MKKSLLLSLILITSSFLPSFYPILHGMSNELLKRGSKEVVLRSRIASTRLRSMVINPITAIINNDSSTIVLEFRSQGEFRITMSSENNLVYERIVSISENEMIKEVVISTSSFHNGNYTLDIENLTNGEILFGDFTVD